MTFPRAALLLLPLLAACADDYDPTIPGPTMRAGENCLRCHADGFGDEAPLWSAGGTIYESFIADRHSGGVEDVTVTLTDSNGETATATTNERGNFWFEDGLEPPFQVEISYDGETISMPGTAPAGSCNACHTSPDPIAGAPGQIAIPQGI